MTGRGLWKPIALAALGAFVATTGLAAAQTAPLALGERPAREVPVEGAPSRGPAEAPVVVVEFCDVASEARRRKGMAPRRSYTRPPRGAPFAPTSAALAARRRAGARASPLRGEPAHRRDVRREPASVILAARCPGRS